MLPLTARNQALRIANRLGRNQINLFYKSFTYQPQPLRTFTTTSIFKSTPMAAPTDTAAEAVQNSTGITPDALSQTLRNAPELNASHVDIQDISGGCGASFAALIVSDAFQGKSALQRHRLVNGLLKDEIKAIHAWTPKCLTSEQWEKEKQKQ